MHNLDPLRSPSYASYEMPGVFHVWRILEVFGGFKEQWLWDFDMF